MKSNIILKVEKLTKIYKNGRGIKDVSLSIDSPQFHGLIGPNGAGKTTLIKSVVGAYSKNKLRGNIWIFNKKRTDKDFSEKIAYVPEFVKLPRGISVFTYLSLALRLDFPDKAVRKKEIVKWSNVLKSEALLKMKTNQLSSGQEKKILLIPALSSESRLIIMDEPASNLDPDARADFLTICGNLVKDHQKTILISSHVLDELQKHIGYATFIVDGKSVFSGSLDKVKTSNSFKIELKSKESTPLNSFLQKNRIKFNYKSQKYLVFASSHVTKDKILTYALKNKMSVISVSEKGNELIDIYRSFSKTSSG